MNNSVASRVWGTLPGKVRWIAKDGSRSSDANCLAERMRVRGLTEGGFSGTVPLSYHKT